MTDEIAQRKKDEPVRREWLWPVAILLIWGALIAWKLRAGICYTTDSASYIECARNIAAGKAWTQRSYVAPHEWKELSYMWPPGYPLLLAGLLRVGLPIEGCCLLISLASGAITTLLLMRLARYFLPPLLAASCMLTVVCMEGYVRTGIAAMSDGPYLALTTAALVLLYPARSGSRYAVLIRLSLAGLLIGLSWGVRYVGAMSIAVASCYVLGEALFTRKQIPGRLAAWSGGVLAGAGPFTLNNWLVFHDVLPYSMPHSTHPVTRNVPEALGVMVEALTASPTLGSGCGNWWGVGILAAAGLGLLVRFRHSLLSALRQKSPVRFAVFLGTYGAAYLGVVILSRSYYELWGGIDPRYPVPIYWLLWIGIGTALHHLLARSRFRTRHAAIIAAAVIVLVAVRLGRHTAATSVDEAAQPNVSDRRLWSYLRRTVPPDQVVFSCRADLCRIFADVNARKIDPETFDANLRAFRERGKLWAVVIEDREGAARGRYGDTVRRLASGGAVTAWYPAWAEDDMRVMRLLEPGLYGRPR